jgi:hypothetical protein
LLIANYTSEPVCFLRDSAIFGTPFVFFVKIFTAPKCGEVGGGGGRGGLVQ